MADGIENIDGLTRPELESPQTDRTVDGREAASTGYSSRDAREQSGGAATLTRDGQDPNPLQARPGTPRPQRAADTGRANDARLTSGKPGVGRAGAGKPGAGRTGAGRPGAGAATARTGAGSQESSSPASTASSASEIEGEAKVDGPIEVDESASLAKQDASSDDPFERSIDQAMEAGNLQVRLGALSQVEGLMSDDSLKAYDSAMGNLETINNTEYGSSEEHIAAMDGAIDELQAVHDTAAKDAEENGKGESFKAVDEAITAELAEREDEIRASVEESFKANFVDEAPDEIAGRDFSHLSKDELNQQIARSAGELKESRLRYDEYKAQGLLPEGVPDLVDTLNSELAEQAKAFKTEDYSNADKASALDLYNQQFSQLDSYVDTVARGGESDAFEAADKRVASLMQGLPQSSTDEAKASFKSLVAAKAAGRMQATESQKLHSLTANAAKMEAATLERDLAALLKPIDARRETASSGSE